jgi:hypothetical protein
MPAFSIPVPDGWQASPPRTNLPAFYYRPLEGEGTWELRHSGNQSFDRQGAHKAWRPQRQLREFYVQVAALRRDDIGDLVLRGLLRVVDDEDMTGPSSIQLEPELF